MKKFFTLFVLLSVILIPTTGCFAGGPWMGKVIEADTKKPIKGAAVVAVWYSDTTLNPAGSSRTPMKVEETETNASGEFIFDSKYFADVPVFREVSGPLFLVYKPGYGNFPEYQTSPHPIPENFCEKEVGIILLPKFEKKEDRIKAYISATGFKGSNSVRTEKLNQFIQNEEKYLGIEN